jgi:hypothetical protein
MGVKQMALAVVDFFDIGVVRDILDALLGGDDLIVSQAMTATERNSSPFARCIVPMDSLPGMISMLSLSSSA